MLKSYGKYRNGNKFHNFETFFSCQTILINVIDHQTSPRCDFQKI